MPENVLNDGDIGFFCAGCGQLVPPGVWHVCGSSGKHLVLSTDERSASALERIALALETIVQQQAEQVLVETAQTTKAGQPSSKNPRPDPPKPGKRG